MKQGKSTYYMRCWLRLLWCSQSCHHTLCPSPWCILDVVATTRRNGTHSLLTSAKLSEDYLVVGITRELDKEPSLHCSSIYINTRWSVLQQYLLALMSMPLPHVLLLRPPCHIYVPWHHTPLISVTMYAPCVYHEEP